MSKGLGVVLMILGLGFSVYNILTTEVFSSDFSLNPDFNIYSMAGIGLALFVLGLIVFLFSKSKHQS
ncbi:MAG: hypothetical protein AABX26_00570 [Nanoarchaeota archaeon]